MNSCYITNDTAYWIDSMFSRCYTIDYQEKRRLLPENSRETQPREYQGTLRHCEACISTIFNRLTISWWSLLVFLFFSLLISIFYPLRHESTISNAFVRLFSLQAKEYFSIRCQYLWLLWKKEAHWFNAILCIYVQSMM